MKREWPGLLILAFSLAACGGDEGVNQPTPSPTPTSTPTPVPTPSPTPTPAPTQATLTYLHVFSITEFDGAQPNGPLLQASDGNFYGTTRAGGRNTCRPALSIPCGTIFKVTPSGEETVLYSFGSTATDGFTPSAPLIQGNDGALYGVTTNGGEHDGGTAFRITLSGSYSILHSFGESPVDGLVPSGGLVQGRDGDLYGTTASGGANHCVQIPQAGGNCGTVFKVSTSGIETVLYSFGTSPSDGVEPNGSLVQGSDGNFYGTTGNGGSNACSQDGETNNCGTIFRVTPAGAVTILHSFGSSLNDGIAPQGALVLGRDGAFYGTTVSGGGGRCGGWFGCGTVFRVTSGGALTILHAFALNSISDGYGPSSHLIQGADGNFYGTTGSGGARGGDLNGTVFRLTPSGAKTVLYSFGPLNTNPSNPLGGLIQGRDGAYYGVTNYNGSYGAVGARGGSGTVFKLMLQ